jgi:hypothetical protein
MQAYSSLHVTVKDMAQEKEINGQELQSASLSTSAPSSLTEPQASPTPQIAIQSFDALGRRPFLYSLFFRRRIVQMGYNLPTPVQQHAIPLINAGE